MGFLARFCVGYGCLQTDSPEVDAIAVGIAIFYLYYINIQQYQQLLFGITVPALALLLLPTIDGWHLWENMFPGFFIASALDHAIYRREYGTSVEVSARAYSDYYHYNNPDLPVN